MLLSIILYRDTTLRRGLLPPATPQSAQGSRGSGLLENSVDALSPFDKEGIMSKSKFCFLNLYFEVFVTAVSTRISRVRTMENSVDALSPFDKEGVMSKSKFYCLI